MYSRLTLLSFFILLSGCKNLSSLIQTQPTTLKTAPTVLEDEFIAAIISPDDPTAYLDIAKVTPNIPETDLKQAAHGNIWKRIQSQLTFPIPDNRRLKIQRSWYAKNEAYLNRVAKRAEPFLYYIVEQIEDRGLPMELAILPIVESAFDPFAYSPSKASGLWQFMPVTADRFGLRQDWWYDGRRDVVASTKAALDYLEKLHQQFDGNWLHALAAYNSGEGRVARAVQRNYRAGENIDFWSLELPKETEAYVPKLLALADILKRPQDFNIDLYKIKNEPVLDVVDVPSQIDLSLAAKLSNLSLEDLHTLNPGYNRWATAPSGPHRFLLPKKNAQLLSDSIGNLKAEQLLTWIRYQIKSGDSIGKIASKYNTSVDAIKTVNKLKSNMIRKGDFIMIPTANKDDIAYKNNFQLEVLSKQKHIESATQEYVVKRGDTFWDISRAHKMSVKKLAQLNKMSTRDSIFPGQVLKVSAPVVANNLSDAPTTKKMHYTVKRGDSLALIAQKFKVSIRDIEKWNKINRRRFLQPGQKLNLLVDVTHI